MGWGVQGTSLPINRICVGASAKQGQTKLPFEKECDVLKKLK